MQIKEILQKTTDFFREKEVPSARLDAELLIAEALGLSRVDLYVKHEYPLNEEEVVKCRDFVRRRSVGEPVAYILQRRDFFKSTFEVRPGVLVPRPESEHLVEEALAWIDKNSLREEPLRIADFGSGSGCIGLSILKELPQASLTAVDLSEAAQSLTLENARQLGLSHVEFKLSRVQELSSLEAFDVIVANPPYISRTDENVQASVRKFEPDEALFAEDDGLREIREWCAQANSLLKPKGLAIFEIGSTQGVAAHEIFSLQGFSDVRVGKDLAGLDRYVIGVS